MGGGSPETVKEKSSERSESTVEYRPEVRDALQRLSGKSEDVFDINSEFFQSVMIPYQKDMMKVNQDLLPLVSKNMKQQLQISSADMLGESDIRDQLREFTKKDIAFAEKGLERATGEIEKDVKLGDELFAQIMDRQDITGRVEKKRSQIAQEFGRMEQALVRQGIDPTSPEHRENKKEMELEQAKQGIQARTTAEEEAFQALAGAQGVFTGQTGPGPQQRGMVGSMGGANAQAQQFNVAIDPGATALSQAMTGQNILAGERTQTSVGTASSTGVKTAASEGALIGGIKGAASGAATGAAAGPWGALAGGVAGGAFGAATA
jgi:hypothetical protein